MFRDILKDIWRNIFSPYSSFGERCLGAVMASLLLAAVGLVGLMSFFLINSLGITPTKTVVATVEAKQSIPAYTSAVLVGKVMVPQYHPKSYRLHFKIGEEKVTPIVEKKFFDDVSVGDRIEVDYGFGRLSNSHQPKRIRLVGR